MRKELYVRIEKVKIVKESEIDETNITKLKEELESLNDDKLRNENLISQLFLK